LEMRIIPCLRWEGKPAAVFDVDQVSGFCFSHALKYAPPGTIYCLSAKTNHVIKEVEDVFNTTQ